MQGLAESEGSYGPCDMAEFHTARTVFDFAVRGQTDSHQSSNVLLGEILLQAMEPELSTQFFHRFFFSNNGNHSFHKMRLYPYIANYIFYM